MKLILHIGTHKTASTSMQHFCALNRKNLRKYGFHYPKNQDSAYVANFLASRLVNYREKEVQHFMEKAYKDAKRLKCHTVIISAESFYAMTGFFLLMNDKPVLKKDYWATEEYLVAKLKECCHLYDTIKILCYLRPQDDFASSLYNQSVKNVYGISSNYEDFTARTYPIYDYAAHIKIWEECFDPKCLIIRDFEECKAHPIMDFCSQTVGMECFSNSKEVSRHANERLCRDVLEFKREHNKISKDKATAFITVRCFHKMANLYKDLPGYQTFADYKKRKAFFMNFDKGNKYLTSCYKLKYLKSIVSEQDCTYPGLTEKKKQKIQDHLTTLLHKTPNRVELILRKGVHTFIRNIPGGTKMILPVKILYNKGRLVFAKW